MKRLLIWVLCHILGHSYTSLVQECEGVVPDSMKPVKTDTSEEIRQKFHAYARMYCRRCGHDYGGSL